MIAAILLIVTVILSRTKRVGQLITPKIKKIVIVIEIIALAMSIGETVYNRFFFDATITRPAPGEPDSTKELYYEADGDKTDITIDLPAALHSKKQKEAFINKAKEEIDDTFPGDNDDLDSISRSVVMRESYADGMVKAEWQLSDYKIVGAEGEINYDKLKVAEVIDADVTLTCEDISDVYSFSFVVEPLDPSTKEGLNYYINKTIKSLLGEGTSKISLPKKIGDKKVKWGRKYTFLGAKIAILGIVAAIGMAIGLRREEKSSQAKYLRSLKRDYPKIVESLALYVGAGLSVKNALYRICDEYLRRRGDKASPGYEGLICVRREIEEGRSELKAYESLPEYCPSREYRRLSSILVSNLRKGTKGLIDELNREEEDAFDMERAYVKVAGEEASTKLLLPMVGLLGIVLVIIIAPALFNINSM